MRRRAQASQARPRQQVCHCTEVEHSTERYSESPPPVCTKTGKGKPAQRKRCRDFAQQIQVEYDSSSEEAPTASRSSYLWEIHRQIDHNDMLQRRLAHSTQLLRYAERIAMSNGKDPAPQVVSPPAPVPLLDWKQFISSKVCCLTPLGYRGV